MKRNETTSAGIATIAGRMLREIAESKIPPDAKVIVDGYATSAVIGTICTVGELQGVLGSVLTQARDRKRKPKARKTA